MLYVLFNNVLKIRSQGKHKHKHKQIIQDVVSQFSAVNTRGSLALQSM